MTSPTLFSYAIALGIGLVAGLIATLIVRTISRRIGFVDRPDGGRKTHKVPVALGGGLGVYAATLTGILAAFVCARYYELDILNGQDLPILKGLLKASVVMVLLGLIDDTIALRGRYKIIGQLVIAGLMINAGLRIEQFGMFGVNVQLGWASIPMTLFWLLGTINAINLIDGIDGLASSVGIVLCLTVAFITAMLGHFAETVVVLALAGALCGFLYYNRAPASIYLGDTGSMLVGLIAGVISVHTSVKSPAAIAMIVPIAVFSIPILDSSAALLRRKLTGRSLFAPDRGHLHHSLLTRGWSVQQASMFIALICATTCLSAVLSILWKNELIAIATVVCVILFLVFTKTFGHMELALLRHRFRETARPKTGQRSIQLQGSREWDKLWAVLAESADEHQLVKMKLAINIPALHEVYFARWDTSKPTSDSSDKTWHLKHPLNVDGEKVGHIELVGLPDQSISTPAHIAKVLEFLDPIEADIRLIREHIAHDQVVETAQAEQQEPAAAKSLISPKQNPSPLVDPASSPSPAAT